MQKRNNLTKKYYPYEVPPDWNCPLYTENMDELVNCVSCALVLKFGMCYTSRIIHNHIGLGYVVCEECYKKEWELGPID